MPKTPKGSGGKKAPNSDRKKQPEPSDGAAEPMADEAAALLQEALSFRTPREEPKPVKTKAMLPEPLPDTIKAPAIVLQHSQQDLIGALPETNARYDYLKPEEMAAEWTSADGELLRTPLTDRKGGHDITLDNWEERSKGVAKLVIANEKAEAAAVERINSQRTQRENTQPQTAA